VNGTPHTVTAEPSARAIVGCTEAFNVIDEYLTRGTSIDDTPLTNGWSCTTDDGETTSIGCVKGRVGDDYELAFSTRPASS
jgi:hypothetical protein